MKELLNKISNSMEKNRDLLIDELNDLVESGSLNRSDKELVVGRLLELLDQESDPAVNESIFNLIGSVFEEGIAKEKIANSCVAYLHKLPPGCLVHAIPIIVKSNRPDKRALLEPFLNSSNIAVKTIAEESLREI